MIGPDDVALVRFLLASVPTLRELSTFLGHGARPVKDIAVPLVGAPVDGSQIVRAPTLA